MRHFSIAVAVMLAILSTGPAVGQTAPAPAPAAAPVPGTVPAPAPAAQPPAAAQQPATPAAVLQETIGDWIVRCFDVRSPGPCNMQQIAMVRESQQQVMNATIVYVPSQTTYVLQIIVPVGVSIAKGLSLTIGEQKTDYKFHRCEVEGCVVMLEMAQAGAEGLAKANEGIVAFSPYTGEQGLQVRLSFAGYKDALAKLRTEATRRATPP